jgi:vacuolar-type H+-ATPase subunit F/Vma7
MALPILISDRLTAAGFRLAGVRPLVTAAADTHLVFRKALALGGPVLITAALAEELPSGELGQAISKANPPVAVIPDIARTAEPTDMAEQVRRALGVET